jgi:hypothetical protein
LNELFALGSGDSGQHQELNPTIASGSTSFDPGGASFGLWSNSPTFPGRIVYSENALNTWDGGIQKHEVFPYRDINGVVESNAYLVGIEEATNNDFQDYVYVIRNVAPFVPALAGDYNDDDGVDAADYVIWRKLLGQQIALPNETVTPNSVTQEDYAAWRENFGASSGAGATAISKLPDSAPTDAVVDDVFFSGGVAPNNSARRAARHALPRLNGPEIDSASLRGLDFYFETLYRRQRPIASSPAVNDELDADESTHRTADAAVELSWPICKSGFNLL